MNTTVSATNTRKVGFGSGMRVLSFASSTGVALMLTPFVVHSLGDRSYGLWALVTALSSYYALLDLGLSGAVTRHLAGALGGNDGEECNRIASTSLAMYLALGAVVLACSVGIALAGAIFISHPAELQTFRKIILIVGGGTAISIPMRVFFGLINANLRFDISSSLEVLSVLLRAIFTWLSLKSGAGITALAWINFGAAAFSLLLSAYCSRRVSPSLMLSPQFICRAVARKLFSYGSISLVAQVADLLRFQMDALVVAAFAGVAAVTHYNIAGSMAQYYICFMIALTGTLGPLFSRLHGTGDRERTAQVFQFSTKISVAIATFVGFGILSLGRSFIARWMGPSYLDSYPAMVALTLGAMTALCQTPSLQLLYGISKHGLFAVFNSLEGVANLVLSILLVRHFGLLGVALGTMIPMALTKLFVQPWYFCRIMHFDLWDYYALLGKSFSAAVLALLLPAALIFRFAAADYKVMGVLLTVSLLCFVPVLFFLLFTSPERDSLRNALGDFLNRAARSQYASADTVASDA
jgi:O-antigen/teichoic acid export membrane protein